MTLRTHEHQRRAGHRDIEGPRQSALGTGMPVLAAAELVDEVAMPLVPVGQPVLGITVALVADVVVRPQRVLHQVPGVVVAVPAEESLHLVQRILAGQGTLAFVVGVGIPGRAEAAGIDDPRIVRQVLGDEVFVGEIAAERSTTSFECSPLIWVVTSNREPVGVIFLEEHPGVLVEEVLDLLLPPGRTASPVGRLAAFEVDAAVRSL